MATKALKRPMPSLSGFVNLNGDRVTGDGPSFNRARSAPPSSRRPMTLGEENKGPTEHHGWMPCGFSPAGLAAAQQRHAEAERATQRLAEQEERPYTPRPFDEDAYMNNAKPQTAKPSPYAIESSAAQCAELLRKAGWKRVCVVEIKK